MTPASPHPGTQGQIFKNPFLEYFTRTNLLVHLFTYGLIIFLFLFFTFVDPVRPVYAKLLWMGGGFFFWTFFEYLMHRYLFHIASESKFLQKLQHTLHGVHHEFPRDEERVFMPPLPGTLILGLLFGFFYLFLRGDAFPFLAGLSTGYLVYSLMHYSMHHLRAPHFLKQLWKNHALHHYKYPDKGFGVSSTFWDFVFGTLPPGKPGNKKQDL